MRKFYFTYYTKKFNTILTIYQQDVFIVKISFKKNEDMSYIKKETFEIKKCKKQIDEYFCGDRKYFEIEYKLPKYTDFQKKIIYIVNNIPYASTMSYLQIANISGHNNSSRAVGTVMAKNMLPIIIPCHRVIKSDGKIGQYLGGSNMKKMLLDIENTNIKKDIR